MGLSGGAYRRKALVMGLGNDEGRQRTVTSVPGQGAD